MHNVNRISWMRCVPLAVLLIVVIAPYTASADDAFTQKHVIDRTNKQLDGYVEASVSLLRRATLVRLVTSARHRSGDISTEEYLTILDDMPRSEAFENITAPLETLREYLEDAPAEEVVRVLPHLEMVVQGVRSHWAEYIETSVAKLKRAESKLGIQYERETQ